MTAIERLMRVMVVAAVAAAALTVTGGDAVAWNQSEIDWFTIETEHFRVNYHEGLEWSAERSAVIAEEVYSALTCYYDFELDDKVHINVSDRADLLEGASYYYLNRIDINPTEYEFHFRGTADWLRNVITHEFTHMVSLQRSMKYPRRLPSFFLQAISFEKEKRPDVITGYPNFQGSVPLPGEVVPNWFAEGVAQYQCDVARNDIWDSHRDMMLRTAALNGNLLSLDEMSVFGKGSLDAEMLYNQGFSLVRFIAEEYGRDRIPEIMRALGGTFRLGFDGACREMLGMGEGELYDRWRASIEADYRETAAAIATDAREGRRIAGKGFMNLFPVPDRRRESVLFLSNRGGDYSGTDLVEAGRKETETVFPDASTRFDLSTNGSALCVAKRTRDNDHGYRFYDLFIIERETGKSRRLTRSLRATDPAFSPDGSAVACVVDEGGSQRIATVETADGTHRTVTPHVPGRQYFGLSWSGEGIYAARFDGESRDIVLVDPTGGVERTIVAGAADERDPAADGEGGCFFSSDRTGIFDIYHRDAGGNELRVTNTIGGAFAPRPDGDGIVFTAYGAGGYEIRRIDDWRAGAAPVDPSRDDARLAAVRERCIANPAGCLAAAERDSIAESVDGQISDPRSFGVEYTSVYFFPAAMVYDGTFRVGLSLNALDVLDRQSIFANGSINADGEFDGYIGVEIRQFKPTFLLEVYRSRKFYEFTALEQGRQVAFKTRYDLWDAFFTCRFELNKPSPFKRKDISLVLNHGEYGLNIEAWEVFDQEVGWNYYKSNEASALFDWVSIRREVDADVNPRAGRRVRLAATVARDQLSSGEFEYVFQPIYNVNDFNRFTLSWEEYVPMPFRHHALSVFVRGGYIDNNEIDDFFDLYLGSRDGLRGYTYYSLGGKKLAMGRIAYRFPILRGIDRRLSVLHLSSLYGGLFAETGQAWDTGDPSWEEAKSDVGFELRLKGFSFYSYPLAASFEAAYGLDDVTYTDPFNEELVFYEGKKWKFYGSVLFGF